MGDMQTADGMMTALRQDEVMDGMLVDGMTGGGVPKGVTTAVTKDGVMLAGLVADGPLELVSDAVKGGKWGTDNVQVELRGMMDESVTAGDLMLGTMTTEPGLLQDEVMMDNVLDEKVMNDGTTTGVTATALAPRARCASNRPLAAARGWNRAPP